MKAELKMSTSSGQVYIDNKCLHQDKNGYYTISTSKFCGKKIQIRNNIVDASIIEKINKFINS